MVRTTEREGAEEHAVGGSGKEPADDSKPAAFGADEDKKRIVSQFTERALRGEPEGWRQLLSVGDRGPRMEEPGTNHNNFSQAIAWEAEPEWQGE